MLGHKLGQVRQVCDFPHNFEASWRRQSPPRQRERSVITGNGFQSSKTHCPRGHAYTPENTKLAKSRSRATSNDSVGRVSPRQQSVCASATNWQQGRLQTRRPLRGLLGGRQRARRLRTPGSRRSLRSSPQRPPAPPARQRSRAGRWPCWCAHRAFREPHGRSSPSPERCAHLSNWRADSSNIPGGLRPWGPPGTSPCRDSSRRALPICDLPAK